MMPITEVPAVHTLRVAACLSALIPAAEPGRHADPLKAVIADGVAVDHLLLAAAETAIGGTIRAAAGPVGSAQVRDALRRWGAAENLWAAAE